MNKKRHEILSRCSDRLGKIAGNLEHYRYSKHDFSAICEICKHFTAKLDEDEIFSSIKNVANFFGKTVGFSVEECDGQYHIFIEDKENEISYNK